MKRKASKISKVTIAIVLTVLILVISFFGIIFALRRYEPELKEDGFFQYIVVGKDGPFPLTQKKEVIAIVGFTPLGKQQEVIDFPREIEGKPVQHIGYRNYSTFMDSFYHLESPNLKKVYIHESIKSVYREAFSWFAINNQNLDFMVCASKSPYLIFSEYYFGTFYVYNSVYNSSSFDEKMFSANIVYMNNYSTEINEGYYRLDNIEMGEKISEPPSPERSGYEFTGWFTEPECINTWNFNVSPTIEVNTEFRLYAGWRAV